MPCPICFEIHPRQRILEAAEACGEPPTTRAGEPASFGHGPNIPWGTLKSEEGPRGGPLLSGPRTIVPPFKACAIFTLSKLVPYFRFLVCDHCIKLFSMSACFLGGPCWKNFRRPDEKCHRGRPPPCLMPDTARSTSVFGQRSTAFQLYRTHGQVLSSAQNLHRSVADFFFGPCPEATIYTAYARSALDGASAS